MEVLKIIFRSFKPYTIVAAILAFALVNVALDQFILAPDKAAIEKTRQDLEEMKETYVDLRSTDMAGIARTLQEELTYLSRKQNQISSSRLSRQEIPLFVSGLERSAEIAGLTVDSEIVQLKKGAKSMAVNVNYTGSIRQVLNFLSALDRRDEVILVRNFKIYNPDSAQNELNGEMQVLSLLAE